MSRYQYVDVIVSTVQTVYKCTIMEWDIYSSKLSESIVPVTNKSLLVFKTVSF